MKKLKFLIVSIVGTVLMIAAGQANAVQISLLPTTQILHPGDEFFVVINISGLHDTPDTSSLLGGWMMDIGYFPGVLQPTSFFSQGSYLGSITQNEAIEFPAPDYSVSGVITLGELSLLPINNYLDGNVWKRGLDCVQRKPQCDPNPGNGNPGGQPLDLFRLATVGFRVSDTATLNQLTDISTANIVLSDGDGNAFSVASNPNISVHVVSEPTTIFLILIGFVAMSAIRNPNKPLHICLSAF